MSQHSKRRLVALAGVVIVLAAAHPSWAQRGRGFRRIFGVSEAQLATLDEVQSELKMTDKQKRRVAKINNELGEKRRELFGTGFEGWSEIRPRMEGLNRDASESVDKVLNSEQRKRLQEIAIQQNGARSLSDPDVVAELGLSDEQKTRLVAAVEENSEAFEKAVEESGRDDWRQRVGELSDESDKRLLGVLNDEQKTKFEQMKGKEFEVDLSQLFRGGRGGR